MPVFPLLELQYRHSPPVARELMCGVDANETDMPQIVEALDEIARLKQRDVLCVRFFDPERGFHKNLSAARKRLRSAFIQFLDEHAIRWSECFDAVSPNLQIYPYCGSLYLDVPRDLADPKYRLIADYLETPDGQPRYDGMYFCVLSLQAAIKNAEGRADID